MTGVEFWMTGVQALYARSLSAQERVAIGEGSDA